MTYGQLRDRWFLQHQSPGHFSFITRSVSLGLALWGECFMYRFYFFLKRTWTNLLFFFMWKRKNDSNEPCFLFIYVFPSTSSDSLVILWFGYYYFSISTDSFWIWSGNVPNIQTYLLSLELPSELFWWRWWLCIKGAGVWVIMVVGGLGSDK